MSDLQRVSYTMSMQAIGHIQSQFESVVGMPIQTVAADDVPGQLHVAAEYLPGLRDIEGFEFLILITYLHEASSKLEVVPFMDTCSHGVFATRSPARPNKIGLSIVRLLRVEGSVLYFQGNDMLNGTPVLDIKPYVPELDVRQTDRIGWFEHGLRSLGHIRSDDRMK